VRAPVFLLALALGAAAAMLVACGDRSGLIPSGDASQLERHLDQVNSAVAAGDCPLADVRVTRVQGEVENLRAAGIDARLYRRLRSGVSLLASRAAQECQASTTVPTETQTTETQPQTTETTTTPSTTPTETNTDTVPTTPTQPTTPTTPTTPDGTGGVGPGTGTTTGAGVGG
jgi:hypothetical protein